jgi:hypothetical protein
MVKFLAEFYDRGKTYRKVKVRFHPVAGHMGPEREQRCSSTLS